MFSQKKSPTTVSGPISPYKKTYKEALIGTTTIDHDHSHNHSPDRPRTKSWEEHTQEVMLAASRATMYHDHDHKHTADTHGCGCPKIIDANTGAVLGGFYGK